MFAVSVTNPEAVCSVSETPNTDQASSISHTEETLKQTQTWRHRNTKKTKGSPQREEHNRIKVKLQTFRITMSPKCEEV